MEDKEMAAKKRKKRKIFHVYALFRGYSFVPACSL